MVRVEIVLLWAGLAFVAVGASIVVLEARARKTGAATEGRVVGYSERPGDSGRMYRAVIEFVDLAGRKRLIESPLGSGVPIGRVGDQVRIFLRLEDAGVMLRIDRDVTPTMAKTPTLGTWELDLLRTIEHVVRMGHITRVTRREMQFDEGEVQKKTYERETSKGTQTRYAFQAETTVDGDKVKLTKFVGKEDFDRL